MSPVDVEIANKLKSTIPDVATALGSTEAAAMRANAAYKDLNSAGSTAFTGLVSDIASGTNAMDALIARVGQLGKSMTDIGSKSLMGSLQSGLSGKGFNFDPVSLGIGLVGTAVQTFAAAQSNSRNEALKTKNARLAWQAAAA